VVCDTRRNEVVLNSGMAAQASESSTIKKNQIYGNVILHTAVKTGSTIVLTHK